MREFRHALQLDPNNALARSRIARILAKTGRVDEAVEEWRKALGAYREQVDKRQVSPEFWESVPAMIREINDLGARDRLDEAIHELLDLYVSQNGGYQVGLLAKAVVQTASDPSAEMARILDLADKANNPLSYLSAIDAQTWVPGAQRETVLERAIEAARRQMAQARGQGRFYAQQAYDQWQTRSIEYLLETKQAAKAQAAVDNASATLKTALAQGQAPLAIRVAALSGQLEEVLTRYEREDDSSDRDGVAAPGLDALRDAAAKLAESGDETSAQRLLEFYYTRLLSKRELSAANFLGLAELRLKQQQGDEALGLLRRMLLVAGEPFEHHKQAAALLMKMGRPSDAAEMLAERVEAAPWDREAQLDLARARRASGRGDNTVPSLIEVASAGESPYELRLDASRALAEIGYGGQTLGSLELETVAGGVTAVNVGPSTGAARPFFVTARLAAAASATDADERLRWLREALEIRPSAHQARIELFRTARELGRHRLAVNALSAMMSSGRWESLFAQRDPVLGEQSYRAPIDEHTARQFVQRSGFEPRERARLAREAGDSLEQLGRLGAATAAYQATLQLDPGTEGDGQARGEVEEALARLGLERSELSRNARVRPVISKNLEQDRLVRPQGPTFEGEGSL